MGRSILACLGVAILATAGCKKKPTGCDEATSSLRATVTFSGFSSASATRVEFETRVRTDRPPGFIEPPEWTERRVWSISFAATVSGPNDFPLDVGSYPASVLDSTYALELTVRVFGRGGTLLGEGSLSETLPTGRPQTCGRSNSRSAINASIYSAAGSVSGDLCELKSQ